jgi:tetratricopeptide (TPR) repeat protein
MATTMIERHYDDEALIALIANNRAASDLHLPGCEPCSAKIESFRMITDALCDQDLWDTRPIRTEAHPATIATLRAFADRMSYEDTLAEAILPELLAGSREQWMPRLTEHPEWRTAGVVRKLIARAYDAVVAMPPDAVEMMALATDVADRLDSADHPSDTVARLRGGAWLEKAYALFYVGQFTDAEAALLTAERHLSYCAINEYDLARLGVTRALVLRPFARLQEAAEAADTSANTFIRFADATKTVAARVASAHLLFSRESFTEAVELLEEVEREYFDKVGLETQVLVLNNLAYGYRKVGQTDLALVYYDMITAIYDERGMATESARACWNCAAIAASVGNLSVALDRLETLGREFDRLGMTSESALVSLDRAEVLLAQGRYDVVEELCRYAMSRFEQAGLSYSTRALTALAFIQEASSQRRVNPVLIKEVREYLRKLPAQPNLLFAPPPPDFGF